MERNGGLITLIRKEAMKSTIELKESGYYVIESIASAKSCYFETDKEAQIFKTLLSRYLEKYVEIHKIYLSSEGYQVLLRVRMKETILRNYRKCCKRRNKVEKAMMLKEPWRIVSEQMRQFKSLYVKTVNKLRGRKGVLVQSRYRRYYFEQEEEYRLYEREMDCGKEILSQENREYGVERRRIRKVNWGLIRGREWVESVTWWGFRNLVVSKLVRYTISKHSPPI